MESAPLFTAHYDHETHEKTLTVDRWTKEMRVDRTFLYASRHVQDFVYDRRRGLLTITVSNGKAVYQRNTAAPGIIGRGVVTFRLVEGTITEGPA